MAVKLIVAYLVYMVVVFMFYTYVMKTDYSNALIKSIISGVVFTLFFAYYLARKEKAKDTAKK